MKLACSRCVFGKISDIRSLEIEAVNIRIIKMDRDSMCFAVQSLRAIPKTWVKMRIAAFVPFYF